MKLLQLLTQLLSREKPIEPPALPMIKPPPDPEVDQPMAWEMWENLMGELRFPGWTPCRFASRAGSPTSTDKALFVFGCTKGDYGIFQREMYVCDLTVRSRDPRMVSTLIYLPSGHGLGLFSDRAAAASAADLACDLLANPPPTDDSDDSRAAWAALIDRIKKTWEFHGIAPSPTIHTHAGWMGNEMSIYAHSENATFANRPERLS